MWLQFSSDNLPLNLANFQFWCFSVPKLDGKFYICSQCHNLPLKLGNNIIFANFMKTLLLSFNGKFMFQLYLVLIYHPIQAYFSLTNPGILSIMVNFDSVVIVIFYHFILAILTCLPTLDGKFCLYLQCHDLPVNTDKKFS